MNMIMVLFGMCLFCGVMAVYVGLKNRREERRERGSRADGSDIGEFGQKSVKEGARRWEERHAHGKLMLLILISGCVALVCRSSLAQEVVHAVPGDLVTVNPAGKTLTLKLDDGSTRIFKDMIGSASTIEFDRTVQAQTTPAAAFSKVGAHVLIFFYGYGDLRTAVAIKDLGAGHASKLAGTVAEFDHHQHVLTLKADNSELQKAMLTEQTVVDTPDGVIDGLKFHPSKGQHVGVVSMAAKGAQTAVFVSAS